MERPSVVSSTRKEREERWSRRGRKTALRREGRIPVVLKQRRFFSVGRTRSRDGIAPGRREGATGRPRLKVEEQGKGGERWAEATGRLGQLRSVTGVQVRECSGGGQ
jgi:hypothetical protein